MSASPEHIPAVINSLSPFINKYGYLGVGLLVMIEDFGVPLPGETVLIAAAFYAALGHLNIWLVGLIGFIAAIIGDNIGYLIGREGGYRLVLKFGKYVFITEDKLKRAEAFFRRYGGGIVTPARFIEGLRQLNGIIAGISEMPWPKFLGFNALGALLWVSCWSAVGYFSGNHIATFLHYEVYLTLGVLGLVVLYVVFRLIKRFRRARA